MNTTNLMSFEDFYSDKINDMTLQEALDMHYAINPQFTHWTLFPDKIARDLIRAHDISHVVYGCDTSYMGELFVQSWNKYGSSQNIPMNEAPKYLMNKDLRSLVLPTSLFSFAFSHIGDIISNRNRVKKQAKSMTKKWQYFQEDLYLDKKVGDIRMEYNIDILLDS
jgi:ubiquinone biosynthesis protein Coq4